MSFKKFTNKDNKNLLWSLLKETNIFTSIPHDKQSGVIAMFETMITTMKPEFDKFKIERINQGYDVDDENDDDDGKTSVFFMNMNKLIIKKVIDEINKMKSTIISQSVHFPQSVDIKNQQNINNSLTINNTQPSQPFFQNITSGANMFASPNPKPKMEMIYKAEDIKNERQEEIQMKLKEKEAEMNMYLNAKKPQHIDFTDKIEEEEKIGNNMDRLIADALASRERELQQLSNNVDLNKAKEWLGNNDQNKIQPHKDSSNTVNPFLIHQNKGLEKQFTTDHEKKNVRFNNKDEEILELDNYDLSEYNEITTNLVKKIEEKPLNNESNFFLSKLKPKINENTHSNDKNSNTFSNEIEQLKSDIKHLQIGQDKILTLLHNLLQNSISTDHEKYTDHEKINN